MTNAQKEIDLAQVLDIVLRRRWIIAATAVLVFAGTALLTFSTRPVYQASALLVIEKEKGTSPVFANGSVIESSNDDYYQTQYKLLQSYSLLQSVHEKLKLSQYDDFMDPNGVEKLQRAESVAPVLRSRLVYVRVKSHSAQLAAEITNVICETFVQQNLTNQLFISKEVLQALQADSSDPAARQRYDALPAVVNNPLIQSLKGDYARLESQSAELAQKVTEKHPALIALRSNMAALRTQIRNETDKIVQSLKTELSGQLRGNNVRIVDPARTPEIPLIPNKRRSLALGVLGGLFLGFILAVLIEMLDQTIRTSEDVTSKLDIPFLALIPHTKIDEAKIYGHLLAKEPSLTSEAFRNLRTMVDFAGVSQGSKALLVTSSLQEEGKSFVATNLAVVFSQMGERVLLIDGDLRRPKLHKNMHVPSERGLSDYLISSQGPADAHNLILETDVPNLKVLPCGPRPPNPSELLNTPRLSALVAWAKSNFDRVIVDCTPMFPISDTLLWSRHIASVVFIIRYGQTRAGLVREASQRLRSGGAKLLGAAVNSATPGGLSYASYGYYYQQYYKEYARPEVASRT